MDWTLHKNKVVLTCVKEGKGRLRVRFYAYVDLEGIPHYNAYSNHYNCQFPKNLRIPGRFYTTGVENVSLKNTNSTKTPFYAVKKTGISVIFEKESDSPPERVFRVEECVICLDLPSGVVLTPCGHLCLCKTCYSLLAQLSVPERCPLCRAQVEGFISNVR